MGVHGLERKHAIPTWATPECKSSRPLRHGEGVFRDEADVMGSVLAAMRNMKYTTAAIQVSLLVRP
jgi:hypothetical protein